MEKIYKEIQFLGGENIESAMNILNGYKERNELASGLFNAKRLYSDIDDLDSAYKKVTGKTKSEFDEAQAQQRKSYQAAREKHMAAIPELTKKWIKKGNTVLDKKYHKLWAECVPIRLDDLYEGMELRCCLDIVKKLNKGCKLETAKKTIEKQGHSGMSFGLVRSMVKSFCDRGDEFASFVK